MKKIIYNIILVIYAIIAVFTTVCLLSYNEYKVTEFGNYALIIVDNDELEPKYTKGDLLIVNKNDLSKTYVGDNIFFYKTENKEVNIALGEVKKKEVITNSETTYTLDGDLMISSASAIGPSNTVERLPKVGIILGVLESKWGFLFLVVLPSLIAFIYEIWAVITEAKKAKKE